MINKLPVIISEKIVNDYYDVKKNKMSRNNYELIMNEFYKIDVSVLQARLNKFMEYDNDNDGSIDLKELSVLNSYLNRHLLYTNNESKTYTVYQIYMNLNKSVKDKLNFLDIHKYMRTLNVTFT